MRNFLVVSISLFLTACGGQLQTQPYNPYLTNPTGQYANHFQQNLYQQQGIYRYQNSHQALTQPAQSSGYSFTSVAKPQPNETHQVVPTSTSGLKSKTSARQPTNLKAATPSQPKASSPSLSITQSLLQKTRARFESLQNFRGMAEIFETKPGKGPVKAKLKVTFMKPGSSHLEIVDHSNSLYKGAKLAYKSGSQSVTGRPGGAMSFMKMTLPMSDDKVTSRRGYRLDQVDTLAIVNRLIRPELNPKLLGKTTVNGRPVAVLEYQTSGHFDPLITKELLGIDMETYFVRIHEMYAGEELVYSLKLPEVQLNEPISPADLEV